MSKKTILLKLTGEVISPHSLISPTKRIREIGREIQSLKSTHRFAIVVGGGNFFRGAKESTSIGIDVQTGHTIGMLATLVNGLMIQSVFEQLGIATCILSALDCPAVGTLVSQQSIQQALFKEECLLFVGGTGNPFFTTDTNAVLRALQIQADELWKGTKVDGIYTSDPLLHSNANRVKKIRHDAFLAQKLAIMDLSAVLLASDYTMPIRVFNIFEQNALIRAARDSNFGSIITKE